MKLNEMKYSDILKVKLYDNCIVLSNGVTKEKLIKCQRNKSNEVSLMLYEDGLKLETIKVKTIEDVYNKVGYLLPNYISSPFTKGVRKVFEGVE